MNITNIQVPNVASTFINSQETQEQEGFSSILHEILSSVGEETEELSGLDIEKLELVDDETDSIGEDVLPLFFNMGIFESDINNSTNNTVLVDEGVSNNNNVFQPHNFEIQDKVDLITTAIATPSTESNVMPNDNKVALQEGFVPVKGDNPSNIELKDNKLKSHQVLIPENRIMEYGEDTLILEEKPNVLKTDIEESLIPTKDKGTTTQDNKWINNPIREFGKTSLNPKINTEGLELFTDNIQAVNDSIIELVETSTVDGSSVMKVKLNPEELGTVNITLKMEEGKLVAKILVDSNHVKQLFAGKINELTEGLIKQNINIEKIQIDLNTNLDHNLNSNSNPSKNFNQNTKKHYDPDQTIRFAKKPINDVMTRSSDIALGKISILA